MKKITLNLPFDKKLFGLAGLIWLLAPATFGWLRSGPIAHSSLVAPSTYGERFFSSAYVILEHMGWWLWPFGRDWVLRPLDPHGLFAINLLFWLILVLMLRHAWRLRRWNPWVFVGLTWAVVWLLPFSGIIPLPLPPFSENYAIVAGLGLALMVASLIQQCLRFAFGKHTQLGWRQLHAILSVALVVWVGALVVENVIRWQRGLVERVRHTAVTETGNAPAVAELARLEAAAGNYGEAEVLILSAGRAAPWYAEVPYIKAELLLAQGQPEAAQHYLDAILAKDPDDARAQAMLRSLSGN